MTKRELRSRWGEGVKEGSGEGNDDDNGTCESKGEDSGEGKDEGNGAGNCEGGERTSLDGEIDLLAWMERWTHEVCQCRLKEAARGVSMQIKRGRTRCASQQ